jgi:hypothetical protein
MKTRTCGILIGTLLSLPVLSCDSGGSSSSARTAAVLAHHLQSVGAGDLDEIMADYAADAVLCTPNGALRGHDQIRPFFAGLPEILPADFWEKFEMIRQESDGEIAYIVWTAGSAAPLGTDTFVIRDGAIIVQTFAAHMPPSP